MEDPTINDLSIANFGADLESNRETIRVIHKGLSQYHAAMRPDPSPTAQTLATHDEQNLRNPGYGSNLLKGVEQTFLDRGCHPAHPDGYDFQTPDFYPTHEYEFFAYLCGYPAENRRDCFIKSLTERH